METMSAEMRDERRNAMARRRCERHRIEFADSNCNGTDKRSGETLRWKSDDLQWNSIATMTKDWMRRGDESRWEKQGSALTRNCTELYSSDMTRSR